MVSLTLTELTAKTRRRVGLETSQFISSNDLSISDAEIADYLNEGGRQLHQFLTQTDEDYSITKVAKTVAAGAYSFDLPSDCFKIRALDRVGTSIDGYQDVLDYTLAERNTIHNSYPYTYTRDIRYRLQGDTIELLPHATAPGDYVLHYVPAYQELVNGSDTLTAPSWTDYVIAYAALQVQIKRGLPIDELAAQVANLRNELARGAVRRGQPRRMSVVRNAKRFLY